VGGKEIKGKRPKQTRKERKERKGKESYGESDITGHPEHMSKDK
jgi:hypothetical protein